MESCALHAEEHSSTGSLVFASLGPAAGHRLCHSFTRKRKRRSYVRGPGGSERRYCAGDVAGVLMTTSSSPTTNEMRSRHRALSAVGYLRGGGKAPRRLGVPGILPQGGAYF